MLELSCVLFFSTQKVTGVTVAFSSIFSQSVLTKEETYSQPTKQPDTSPNSQSAKPVDLSTDWTYLIFPISAGVAIIIILIVCKLTEVMTKFLIWVKCHHYSIVTKKNSFPSLIHKFHFKLFNFWKTVPLIIPVVSVLKFSKFCGRIIIICMTITYRSLCNIRRVSIFLFPRPKP